MTSTFVPGVAPAPAGQPAVRAIFLQHWLAFPERYEAQAAARLSQRLDEPKRHAIRSAHALTWLPMELDIEVVDAVADVMGAARFSELSRAFFLEIMPRPPLGALLDLGTKVLGLSPESCLRWWDKAWGAVYRGCGSVTGFAEGEGRGRLIYRRMPSFCLQSDAFIEALLGTAHGVYALTGVEGEVRVVQRHAGRGELELGFAWRPRRASAPPATA